MAVNDFEIKTVFRGIDRMTAPIKSMQREGKAFTRSFERGLRKVNRQLDSMTGKAKAVGHKVAAAGALGAAAFFKMAANGAQYEQTLVNAGVKFPGMVKRGTAEFAKLDAAARQVGKTTEFSASQAASAINYLAMAGFNAEQSVGALPGVVNLATASQTDLATATDIASDSLGAFNLMSKDSAVLQKNLARVNDVLVRTTTSANTNMEDMFEAIKDGAPVAVAAGADIETTAALIGEMANAGIKGTRAGTALKNMFLALSAPQSTAARTMRALGVQTVDASGNVRDILDILADFKKAIKGMGTAQQSKIFNNIFGKIPIAAAINLTNRAGAELEAYRKTLYAAGGTADAMAKEMRNTTLGSWHSLLSAIESVSIKIFQLQGGPLKKLIDRMTEWVRKNGEVIASGIGKFLNDLLDNLPTIVKWIKRIGIAVGVLTAINLVMKTLAATLTVVNLLMAANPIVLIVAGITAAIAAVAIFITHLDAVADWFKNLPGWAKILIGAIGGPITGLVLAGKMIYDNWDKVLQFFKDFVAYIKGNFMAAIDKVTGAIHKVVGAAKTVGNVVGNAGSWIGDQASAMGNWIGFGGGSTQPSVDATTQPAQVQVVSPQERIARQITETTQTNKSEVTIKDETGRAEVTKQPTSGARLIMQPSGSF